MLNQGGGDDETICPGDRGMGGRGRGWQTSGTIGPSVEGRVAVEWLAPVSPIDIRSRTRGRLVLIGAQLAKRSRRETNATAAYRAGADSELPAKSQSRRSPCMLLLL